VTSARQFHDKGCRSAQAPETLLTAARRPHLPSLSIAPSRHWRRQDLRKTLCREAATPIRKQDRRKSPYPLRDTPFHGPRYRTVLRSAPSKPPLPKMLRLSREFPRTDPFPKQFSEYRLPP